MLLFLVFDAILSLPTINDHGVGTEAFWFFLIIDYKRDFKCGQL